MIWALLILAGLACGRAVRLVVNDKAPFGRLQNWLKENHKGSWFQVLISCPWCLSGWLSLAAVGGLEWRYSVPCPPLAWFGVWWLAVASYWLTEALAATGVDAPDEVIVMDSKNFS